MENPLLSSTPEGEDKPLEVTPADKPAIDLSANDDQPEEADQAPAEEKKPFFTKGKIIAIIAGIVIIGTVVGALIYSQSSERFKGQSFDLTSGIKLTPVTLERPEATITPDLSMVIKEEEPAAITTPDLTQAIKIEETATITPDITLGEAYEKPEATTPDLTQAVAPSTSDATTATTTKDVSPLISSVTVDKQSLPNLTVAPKVTVTCESATADLIDAYKTNNWDKYKASLEAMVGLKCVDGCKAELYWVIYYLKTNDYANAKTKIESFQAGTCGDDCNQNSALVSIIADILSQKDLASQTLAASIPGVPAEAITTLKTAALNLAVDCGCDKLQIIVTNSPRVTSTYFAGSTSITTSYTPNISAALQSVLDSDVCKPVEKTPNNCKSLTIISPSNQPTMTILQDFIGVTDKLEVKVDGEDNIQDYKFTSDKTTLKIDGQTTPVTKADKFAKLDGGPAEGTEAKITVQAVDKSGAIIKECQDTLTVTKSTTPPVTQEPKNCKSLTITKPSDQPSMTIVQDFNGLTDLLEVTVDGEENIANYKYTSDKTTLTLDGQTTPVTKQGKTVELDGGPAEGTSNSATIKVTAVDKTGAEIKECTDTIKIEKVPTPPVTQETPKVCKSLKIVKPNAAEGDGNVTYIVDKNGFINEDLEIVVDADAGSYADFRYTSVYGDITFDGLDTLDTTALKVKMNGAPPEGDPDGETITVWARDPETLQGLVECHDTFTIKVLPPTEEVPPPVTETPPPVIDTPPPVVIDTPPPVVIDEPPVVVTQVPEQPQQQTTPIVASAPIAEVAPLHGAAAPATTPKTGPGLLIPLFGAAFGGAWMRRRKKK